MLRPHPLSLPLSLPQSASSHYQQHLFLSLIFLRSCLHIVASILSMVKISDWFYLPPIVSLGVIRSVRFKVDEPLSVLAVKRLVVYVAGERLKGDARSY